MSITKTTAWVAGAVAVSLLLTVAAWFLLIAPQREDAAELRAKAIATSSSNAELELRIGELKAEFSELPQRQAELAVVKTAMPEEAQLPKLVRDLEALAISSGVTLMELTPSPAMPVVAPAPPVPVAVEGSAPAEGEAATTVAPAADLLLNVPVSMVIVGNFFDTEVFLRGVQTAFGRDFLVTGLNVVAETASEAAGGKPAVKNGDVTMTVTGSVFVLKPSGDSAPVDSTTPGSPGPVAPSN